MAGIPPSSISSIIQTAGAEARGAAHKARAAGSEAERVRPVGFAERLDDVIKETDRDSQVFSDAEGAGSQGRPFEGRPEDAPEETTEDVPGSSGHLDLEA